MVSKFFAAALVVLCLLPGTAPFSTLDSTHSSGGQGTVSADTSFEIHASANNLDDDDDALVLDRSAFLRQMRVRALVVVKCAETASASTPFLASVPARAIAVTAPALKTVLRL